MRGVWGFLMATEKFPPRLHAIFARSSNVAVVFRRGPSQRVASFLWDRAKDEFQLGQWLKGRIYERRADISPDGRYLIYFAMNGKWKSETRGAWTAVSEAPYLKALDLYAKGDCWEGGGLFLTSKSYWLNDRYFFEDNILRHKSGLARDPSGRPAQQFGAECTGVYYPRLLRDGWTLVERAEIGRWNSQTVFDKPLMDGWTLRKIAHEQVDHPPGKGCYWDEHQLMHAETEALIAFPDWEWADFDRESLVWAEDGKLFRSKVIPVEGVRPQLIHDFTDYAFEAIEAPYNDAGNRLKRRKSRRDS